MDESENPLINRSRRSFSYGFHVLLLFMLILPPSIGLISLNEHRQTNRLDDSVMHKMMEFTENVTLYHLWLEEYATQPITTNKKLATDKLQLAKSAIFHLQRLIQAYSEEQLVHEISPTSNLMKHFDHLIVIGKQRMSSHNISGIDSPQDNAFDFHFNHLLDQIHIVSTLIDKQSHANADEIVSDSYIMLGIEATAMLFIWGALILINQRRNTLEAGAMKKEIQYRTTLEEDLALKNLIIKQKTRLKLHFEQTPIGVIEWTPEFEVVRWNPAAERIFGYTEEEAVGRTAGGLILNEEQEQKITDTTENLIAGAGGYHRINHNITSDGRIILCEWYNTPLIDREGNTVGVASLVFDITEKIQIEKSHQRLVTMLENTSDLVAIIQPKGEFTYLNAAGYKLLAIAPDEALDQLKMWDFHSKAEIERLESEVFPKLSTGSVQENIIFLNRQGEEIPVSCVMIQENNTDGSLRNYMITARDLREEKQAQAKLEHAQRLESLGVLAGGIAHDFNNILTSILGNAALANNKLETGSPLQRYLQNIEDGSQRAAELCKQMLAYSGKGRFIIEVLDINKMVDDIMRLLEVSIRKNVVLKYHLSDNLPMIEGDAAQLQQVIMNLVINASESIEAKSGVISIGTGVMSVDANYLQSTTSDTEVTEPGRYVYLEVSDTGCGMDKKTQKKIFDPFFTTKFTGRGLGMSAILGIVRGHNGAIKCYSEVGKGTTFKVLFACSAKLLPDKHDDVNVSSASTGQQLAGKVLVVDDEETIRETASMILEEMGLTPIQASDGVEGIKMFKKHHKDVLTVLLDMTMPKMDGVEAFTEMRRIDPEIKVILSSGYNEQDAINRFAGKGLAGFIQKPYLPGDLKKTILNVIDVGDG